ncbi:hypothetical protein IC620_00470 [Hazenella sp. IB182357]|uniref:Uncharacterized protein n=1 Tax=Polycladospora coralii TaxID=2771432 RepID=A0A926N4S1_9BACL|nr:hypothetical protein [Polycladospora coralii]MBD1370834.1 hypothetical protein [Polycladospora coralii]MBS7529773.1 hypothetical protein [Polycladospora coralii]
MNFYTMWLLAEGPGKKLQETVGGEVGALFFLAVIIISLTLFWKRAFTAFIGFALFAMLVSVFIFQPQLISSLGSDAFKWLFEAYLK